ncbi:MAG: HDIG domain-containing protein [Methanolinea sp.]|jgi:uncharacterized protein|nr:HDIG domain-containing protein [Methanolinea sp.]
MPEPRQRWETMLREAGCSTRVIAHCRAVRDLAEEYWQEDLMEGEVLDAGALLHDIGRGSTHGLIHAQAGAEFCRRRGIPERVARVVECHLGAGLTADECTLLRLLPIDCIPRSLEERVVANADNLVAGTRRIRIEERMMRSHNLPRRLKRRLFHLWLEMELFRNSPGM